jgi:hypothetical protein
LCDFVEKVDVVGKVDKNAIRIIDITIILHNYYWKTSEKRVILNMYFHKVGHVECWRVRSIQKKL